MTKYLGNELFKIYCRLWFIQKEEEFNFQEAMKILKASNNNGNELRVLSSYFSKIKKAGWMEARLDPDNSRTRLYKLKNPKYLIEEVGKEEYHFETKK